jgi:hypothetical protein
MQDGGTYAVCFQSMLDDSRMTPSPNREQRFQRFGVSIAFQFATWPFGFVFASGLIAIVSSKADARF